MACGSKPIKIGMLDRDLALKKARMDAFFDAIEEPGVKGDMRRLALGLVTGESTDSATALSKATEYFIYGTIGRKPPDGKFILDDIEINRLEASLMMATDDANRAIKRGQMLIKKYKDKGGVSKNKGALDSLDKFWAARGPLTMQFAHSRHLPGGEELFNNLTGLETEHKASKKSASVEVDEIVKGIENITGASFKQNMKDLTAVDARIRDYGNRRVMLEEAYNAGGLKSRKEINELDAQIKDAAKQRKMMLSSENNLNTAGLVNRAVIEMIEAKGGEAARKTIAQKYFDLHKLDRELLIGMHGPITRLLEKHIATGEQSIRYLKRLIDVELDRVGATESEKEEALSSIREMGVIEDGYFPQQSILSAKPIEQVSMLKNMIDAIQSHGSSDPKKAIEIVKSMSKHMQSRSGQIDEANRDYNIGSVLRHYTSTMLHTNYVIKTQFAFGEYLGNLHKIAKLNGSEDVYAYTMAADRMLDFSRKRLVGTQSHGVLHETSSFVLASAVIAKLGIARPAGVIRNLVEGGSMIVTKIGLHNMARVSKILEQNTDGIGDDVDAIIVKNKIKLGGEERWGEETLGTLLTPKIKSLINDPALVEHYLTVERVRAEVAAHKFREWNRVVGKIGNKALTGIPYIGWGHAENFLRTKAFTTGAVMSMTRANSIYKPMFDDTGGKIPKALIDKYDLDVKVLDGNPKNADMRMKEYRKLKHTEGTRGGLSLLYRSQGQYSMLARHPIEDFSPFGVHVGKMIHLFRQYPDSWNTQFLMGIRDAHYATKAGGVAGAFKFPIADGMARKAAFESEVPVGYAMLAMMTQVGLGMWMQEEGKGILGSAIRITGMFRGDLPATFGFLKAITSDDPKEKKWANYGRSAHSMFMGPIAGELEWWLNFAALSRGFQSDSLPLGLHTAAQALGYNNDPEVMRIRPEDLGDTGKISAWHWANGISAVGDVMYLRDEYNSDAPEKGKRMIMAYAKKFLGMTETHSREKEMAKTRP